MILDHQKDRSCLHGGESAVEIDNLCDLNSMEKNMHNGTYFYSCNRSNLDMTGPLYNNYVNTIKKH